MVDFWNDYNLINLEEEKKFYKFVVYCSIIEFRVKFLPKTNF